MLPTPNDTPSSLADLAARMMPTVHRVAYQLARRLPRHVLVDDLVGAGCQGLADALGRFDPERSDGFEAYAELRIRGAILDELRACDPLSRDQRTAVSRITAATRTLAARLGRKPAEDEIAGELGISLETYWAHVSAAATGAVTPLDDELESIAQAPDASAEPVDERLCRKELTSAMTRAVATLSPRLRRVLELHDVEGLTLREVGEQLGVSESRACQIRTEAILRVREICREHIAEAGTGRSARTVRHVTGRGSARGMASAA